LSPIDFNGHGRSDRRATAIWLMNGDAIASTPGLGNVATPWAIAGVGDFDGDGEADLLWRETTSGAIALWFINGEPLLAPAGLGHIPTAWTAQ